MHAFIQTANLTELAILLNGGVIGSRPLNKAAGRVQGLDGLTLIINTTTVTFSDSDGVGLILVGTDSIKAVIEDAVTGVTVSYMEGKLVLAHATGVTVAKTGTANSVFGFDTDAATVGTVYGGYDATEAPRVINVSAGARMDSFFAYVENV